MNEEAKLNALLILNGYLQKYKHRLVGDYIASIILIICFDREVSSEVFESLLDNIKVSTSTNYRSDKVDIYNTILHYIKHHRNYRGTYDYL